MVNNSSGNNGWPQTKPNYTDSHAANGSGAGGMEFKSKTLEVILQPLIDQLNNLTMSNGNLTPATTCGGAGESNLSNLDAPPPPPISKKPSSTSARSHSSSASSSRRAYGLIETLVDSIEFFLAQATELAHEQTTELCSEMLAAIGDVRHLGAATIEQSNTFATDPLSSAKRLAMVSTSRDLLAAVARLLALADAVDVNLLVHCIQLVRHDLAQLKNSSNQDELTHHFKNYGRNLVELTNLTGKRQVDMKDVKLRDELASARATLKKDSLKLFTTSKTLIRHPELSAAQANHDYVFKDLYEAVETIYDINTDRLSGESIKNLYDEAASLAAALDELDKQIVCIEPGQFNEARMRLKLETQLENIISAVALMADSESTRPNRRDRIVSECNVLRQALQDLLNALIADQAASRKSGGASSSSNNNTLEQIEVATMDMTKMTKNLRRQLRKAIIDHISDSFLELNAPLDAMIETAKHEGAAAAANSSGGGGSGSTSGSSSDQERQQLADSVRLFMTHTEKLLEVSSMACSMSSNGEGIKLVRMASIQLQRLTPQVVNAARVLAARPSSKVALENMDVFRDEWSASGRLLTDAVEDITAINDYLAVSENHILDDLNRCVVLLREQDAGGLERCARLCRARTARVCQVVAAETDLYEPDEVINKVLEVAGVLRDHLLANFERAVEYACGVLASNSASHQQQQQQALRDPDDNGFVEASRLVYDGVHDVRNAVLMLYDSGFDSDSELDDFAGHESSYGLSATSCSGGGGVNSSGAAAYGSAQCGADGSAYYGGNGNGGGGGGGYWSASDQHYRAETEPEPLKEDQFQNFPQEQREQIQRQLESFRQEKKNFDREVLKWDDKGNDIIVLAKQMCVIMMEMTDFTRGRGPLKTTMDIISAAKKISECGAKLDKLARDIAEECPESQSKRELDAYLKPIPLFCNQLNIASKVKANVIDVSGEPIITGLDSATSLIISAKNLMTAVVSVVKASYVASTKYMSKTNNRKPIVQWKMKAPEKKPLVITAKPQDMSARVRKASQKKRIEPIKELSEFQA